jgi:hypothetical protein
MRRERLKKLTADVRQHFPPPRKPGQVRVVYLRSRRPLTSEEIDARVAKIPNKPSELGSVVINVIDVRSLKREGAAEDVRGGRLARPAPGPAALEEAALEAQVRELEAKKTRLLEERAGEKKKTL